MPFVSKSQQRWMFSTHPEMAKEWAAKTPDIKDLPNKVKKVGKYPKGSDWLKKRIDNKYKRID